MSRDPFEGYWLLSYELADDPGTEHEEWVEDLADARRHLRGKADMLVWAELHDGMGNMIADKQVMV